MLKSAMTLEKFDSLQHRDFANGAIIEDIREVFREMFALRAENRKLRLKNGLFVRLFWEYFRLKKAFTKPDKWEKKVYKALAKTGGECSD